MSEAAKVQKPQHDTRAAIEFMKRWSPDEIWVLTGIVPDGQTETRTFQPSAWVDAAQWIEERQGIKNLYFHVNPVRRKLDNKASKEDVAALAWLHVDIDPRVGEDFDEERARALKMLREYKTPPTVIVDSGGGYQGFWKLEPDDKLLIDGNVARAQELEAYNVQLEKDFQADHCHDVSRAMRLVGTVNIPNTKKRKKGRKPTLAQLVEWHDDRVYPLSEFTPAVRPSVRTNGKAPSATQEHLAHLRPGDGSGMDVADLTAWAAANGKTIAESTLAVIATGEHPIEPNKYQSRSEPLFRVCCDLIRAEVDDDVIFHVITGPNAIAASVRDKPNPARYALRQIERAHDHATSPELLELNDKHAVIADLGGQCIVVSEVFDKHLKRHRLSKQSFAAIRDRYRHRSVIVGMDEKGIPKSKPLGSWWLDQPRRRQFERIVFAPGGAESDEYNLWQGFAVEAKPGDRHQSFLTHIHDNVCSGNDEHFTYLLGWMARAVQEPDSPGEVAVVMRGKRGTGKSFFGKMLGRLFGRHYLSVSNPKHLVGAFNAHLRDAVLLFGDEAFFACDKQHEGVLKTLITEEQLIIEGKHVDAEASPNFLHIVLASNDEWVVPAGTDERRFFVLDVGEDKKQDHGYFAAIKNDLDSGGAENLLHFLLAYDLSGYEVRRAPKTDALAEQQAESLRGIERYVFDLLWTAEPPLGAYPYWRDERALFVPSSTLRDAATEYLRGLFGRQHVSFEAIRRLLAGKLRSLKDRESGGKREYGYVWDAGAMREAWSSELFAVKWPASTTVEKTTSQKPPF